jgi:hypothetical protein
MENETILSDFEKKQLEEIKKNYNDLTLLFGQLEMQLSYFNEQKVIAQSQLSEINQKEIEFKNLLKYKYGEGTVDIERGLFIGE